MPQSEFCSSPSGNSLTVTVNCNQLDSDDNKSREHVRLGEEDWKKGLKLSQTRQLHAIRPRRCRFGRVCFKIKRETPSWLHEEMSLNCNRVRRCHVFRGKTESRLAVDTPWAMSQKMENAQKWLKKSLRVETNTIQPHYESIPSGRALLLLMIWKKGGGDSACCEACTISRCNIALLLAHVALRGINYVLW